MNKPNDPKQPFDDDIAELFDGQGLEVPLALDDRIRRMAKAELEQDIDVVSVNKSFTARYAPVFATAAVMVLAVALVPMLVDQSKSPVEPSTITVEPMAATPEAKASTESTALATEARVERQVVQEQEVLASAEKQRVLKQESKATKNNKQAAAKGGSAGALEEEDVSNAESLALDISADSIEADSEDDYRVNQESWLEEINRLFEEDKQGEFLYELTLFKKDHPEFDLSKGLSADALRLDSSVGEQ